MRRPTGQGNTIHHMSESRWARWGAISGIVFVVLFVVGFSLIDFPSGDDSVAKITSFYNDNGERAQLIIGCFLLTLSAVFFLWFLASLRARLLEVEGPPGRLTSIAFSGGIVFVTLLMVAAAVFMSVAANITFGDEKFGGAESARLLPGLGYPILLIGGMFAAIAMIDATSVLIIRTSTLPRWIGWFGFVTAVVLLFSFLFFPLLLFLLWVVFTSVALYRASPPGVPAPAA